MPFVHTPTVLFLKPPIASFTKSSTGGDFPLTVNFTNTSTRASLIQWDFENDGSFDATGITTSKTYTIAGTYTVRMRASNSAGFSEATQSVTVTTPIVNGQMQYLTPGTYVFTVPAGVTTISALVVGGGANGSANFGGPGGGAAWTDGFAVTGGQNLTVNVGGTGGVSRLYKTDGSMMLQALGGSAGGSGGPGTLGTGVSGGIARGGSCVERVASRSGGGGGAAGYAGSATGKTNTGGGWGGEASTTAALVMGSAGLDGSGGGAGGDGNIIQYNQAGATGGGGGGGMGIYGVGSNGSPAGTTSGGAGGGGSPSGSTGTSGQPGSGPAGSVVGGAGGFPGGGGGGANGGGGAVVGAGGGGAVRIIWGTGRSYPSNAASV